MPLSSENSIIMEDLKQAKILLDKGLWNEAVEVLTSYVKDYPDSDEAYFLLGNAYRKKETSAQRKHQEKGGKCK